MLKAGAFSWKMTHFKGSAAHRESLGYACPQLEPALVSFPRPQEENPAGTSRSQRGTCLLSGSQGDPSVPGCKGCLSQFLAGRPWASYLTFLCLNLVLGHLGQ